VSSDLNGRVSIWEGNITTLKVDAIVNAANHSLLGGGGVDGAIHRAAGPGLRAECACLNGCQVGEAKITKGYHLPAKHVIHTVGPQCENSHALRNCYANCLKAVSDHHLKTVAFPCIATGLYGYPKEPAAHIALSMVRQALENDPGITRVIFCVFSAEDRKLYEELMEAVFPLPDPCLELNAEVTVSRVSSSLLDIDPLFQVSSDTESETDSFVSCESTLDDRTQPAWLQKPGVQEGRL